MRSALLLLWLSPLACGLSTVEMVTSGSPPPAPSPVVVEDAPAACDNGTHEVCTSTCGSIGERTCAADSWSACQPAAEDCDNGIDDDCDGKVDHADPDCPAIKHRCEDSDGPGCNGDLGYGDRCAPADNENGCSASRFHAWCNRRNPATPGIWDGWVESWVDTRCDGAVSQSGATFHCLASSNDVYECTTPLVLVFRGTAEVRFEPSSSRFAFTPGRRVSTDWPDAATPWLVRDLNGNGRIDDGTELFGSDTVLSDGRNAVNGFAALEALDADRDGVVDSDDPGFSQLRVWRDRNADRISQPEELTTLRQEGINSLSTVHDDGARCDLRGNCERQRARFTGVFPGELVDVYLRIGGRLAAR